MKQVFIQPPKNPVSQTLNVVGDAFQILESSTYVAFGVVSLAIAGEEKIEAGLCREKDRQKQLDTSAILRANNATRILNNAIFDGLDNRTGKEKEKSALIRAVPQTVDDCLILAGEAFGLLQKLNPWYHLFAAEAGVVFGALSRNPIVGLRTSALIETAEMKSGGVARIYGIIASALVANAIGAFDKIEVAHNVMNGLQQVAIEPVFNFVLPAFIKAIEATPWSFEPAVQILSGLSGNK